MMAGRQMVLQRLRQAALAQEGGPTDAALMERFTVRRDAAALEALIRRHGSMVLAVCRRVLAPTGEPAYGRRSIARRSSPTIMRWGR